MTDLTFIPTKSDKNNCFQFNLFSQYTGIFQLSFFADKFVHAYASHTCDWISGQQQIPV